MRLQQTNQIQWLHSTLCFSTCQHGLQKYGRTSRVEPFEGRTLHILPVSVQSIQILLSINCL